MKPSWLSLISLLFVVLFMTACGSSLPSLVDSPPSAPQEVAIEPSPENEEEISGADATEAAALLEATVDAAVNATLTTQAIEAIVYTATAAQGKATRITQAAENIAPEANDDVPKSEPFTSTPSPEPFTSTPEPVPFTPTPPPTDVPESACLSDFSFEEDVTIPDGSSLQIGFATVKRWRVKNTGTCTWERKSYSLVPFKGEPVGVLTENPVPSAEAGESVELSLVFIVPLTLGEYQSSWRMQDGNGTSFGPPLTVVFETEERRGNTASRLNPPLEVEVDPAFFSSTAVSQDTLIPMSTHSYLGGFGGSFASDIATMHADGTFFNQLTTYGYNADPRPSPNGQRIAYRSVHRNVTALIEEPDDFDYNYEDGGYFNILALSVDGVDVWQVTDSEVWRSIPVWSPDSQSVAFIEGPDRILVEVNLDQQTQKEWAEDVKQAKYIPDGSGISYITTAGDLVSADWNGVVNTIISVSSLLADATLHDFDWLPDSQQLLYTTLATIDGIEHRYAIKKAEVFIASSAGKNAIKLADGIRTVNVAPDGIWVASESGSGYGDGCGIDLHASFLKLAPDRTSAEVLHVDDFASPLEEEHLFQLVSDLKWIEGRLVALRFYESCTILTDYSGHYLIDPIGKKFVQITQELVP
jgi:hypothetical protein